MMHCALEALDQAGLARPGIDEIGRTGVYIGASAMDHAQRFAGDIELIDASFMTGNTLSVIANQISYFFDFRGPSYVVDTACASSMTALQHAVGALSRGEVDTAVVGGVSVLLQPWNYAGFSAASMLSPRGLCHSFDASADGYVRGEGAVVLVSRRTVPAHPSATRSRPQRCRARWAHSARRPGCRLSRSARANPTSGIWSPRQGLPAC